MRMKRSVLISTVDVLAFISFLFLICTGFLMKYLLPPGSGRVLAEGGSWRAAQRPVALVWGMTRHEWGDLHFWLSVAFLLLIAVHLLIHWKWIRASFRSDRESAAWLPAALGVAALLGVLLLAAAPFVSGSEEVPRGVLQEERGLLPAQPGDPAGGR